MENLLKMLLLLAILHSVLGFSSSGDQDAEKDGVVSPLLRNVRISAVKRSIGSTTGCIQSRRRPLLGPSPG